MPPLFNPADATPRKPLPPSKRPRTARRQLGRLEKGMIIALYHTTGKVAEVAEIMQRPWSTIKSFLDRANERGTIQNLTRPGRPEKLDQEQQQQLIRAACNTRTMSRRQLRDGNAPEVSLHTVDRVLRKRGIKKWRAKKRPALTASDARRRLAWALERQHWTADDFEGVVWSDECSVEKSRNPNQLWVFRTLPEKWVHECIDPKKNGGGVSLMVWGCFWGRNRGTFTPLIVKSVNKYVYLQMLQYLLVPVLNRVKDTVDNPRFMQDNAPIHKAHIVTEWFEVPGVDIVVENHPPYSPDLNPIEHVWVELKKRFQSQYPNIKNTPGGPKRVKERLAEVLPLVWDTIPEDFFERLWKSMPDRVAAVIAAGGWQTKY
ncbi:uncharacterized protein H6S33_004545 [Morchella sextelata]|uniref:uncharacterized protein n=1 Tax=Morchella sextelata TaxID=1174677 RepID=UPI001D0530AB|nr:uncharacterized protein H6S33_004545 [Morchella sextelata]KAH0605323.1 hypothetical protein H6S33_004545 [Morchella sextelata]